jgi:hypothetical protein
MYSNQKLIKYLVLQRRIVSLHHHKGTYCVSRDMLNVHNTRVSFIFPPVCKMYNQKRRGSQNAYLQKQPTVCCLRHIRILTVNVRELQLDLNHLGVAYEDTISTESNSGCSEFNLCYVM